QSRGAAKCFSGSIAQYPSQHHQDHKGWKDFFRAPGGFCGLKIFPQTVRPRVCAREFFAVLAKWATLGWQPGLRIFAAIAMSVLASIGMKMSGRPRVCIQIGSLHCGIFMVISCKARQGGGIRHGPLPA
ncbi:MAG: hypothetical protein ONB49_06075, partial [candidate division KSB1 bacterium]|nr:hypothetical protein [candidate division KSB1 bacterium]